MSKLSATRIPAIFLVLMFLSVLFLPFCLWMLGQDKNSSDFEKRTLQEFPRCELKWRSLITFPKRMEKYFDDHFGLRNQLITWHNLIHVSVFKKSPNKAVTLGRKNWLFYNADHCLADFLGIWKVDRVQFETWRRIIRDRQTWLADRGVYYLVAIIPTKMMVYPQFLPNRIRKFAGTTILEEFLCYVREKDGGLGVLDLANTLREMEPFPSFFRTDTHWNGLGALRAYQQILENIRQHYPEIKPLVETQKSLERIHFQGDLSTMLNLSSQLEEQSVSVRIHDPCSREVDSINQADLLRIEAPCVENSHTLLMIHDSYGMFISPLLNETFHNTMYTRFPLPRLKELVDSERPSVIIDQRAVRYFSRMLGQDNEIKNYVMRKHLHNPEDIRLYINRDEWEKYFRKSNHLQISRVEKGMLLHSIGPDPYIEIHFPHIPVPDTFLVHIELTSTVETTMQIFYTTSDNLSFGPDRVINRSLQKGFNEVLLRLPHPDIEGKLRFDPGMTRGTYILHSMRIIGERYTI